MLRKISLFIKWAIKEHKQYVKDMGWLAYVIDIVMFLLIATTINYIRLFILYFNR